MTTVIQSLSIDILLELLAYVDYKSRIEFASCCLTWASSLLKKFLRKVTVNSNNNQGYLSDTTILRRNIKRSIASPFNQLFLEELPLEGIRHLLTETDYSLHKLQCKGSEFLQIIKSSPTLRVKNLWITSMERVVGEEFQEIDKNFMKINDCDSLLLHFKPDLTRRNQTLPVVSFTGKMMISEYLSRLQYLCLINCTIDDVSMLGNIRHLELKVCENLVNISGLHNNQQVMIRNCRRLVDYTNCFSNSRIIELELCFSHMPMLDLTKWLHVENLYLSEANGCWWPCVSAHLPKTVKKCCLRGSFVSAIKFTVTSDHILHELKLSNNNTITSFEGYGLERVAIIECDFMRSLQSLEGLGRGRNRKIIISNCNKITDFSPLNHVPIVEIKYCEGFTDPLQVRCVRDLTIYPTKEIRFNSDLIHDNNPYQTIHTLRLFNTNFVKDFDGLEKIPFLQLDWRGRFWIERFLKTGKSPKNQEIILVRNNKIFYSISELNNIHAQYMKENYDYYNYFPQKWIWIKK